MTAPCADRRSSDETSDRPNRSHDWALNLTKDEDGYGYQYDYENRIVKITKDSNDIAEFAYDALGRRIEKKDLVDSNNTRHYYYNNNWQVLSEHSGSGIFKAWYAYGNYTIIHPPLNPHTLKPLNPKTPKPLNS